MIGEPEIRAAARWVARQELNERARSDRTFWNRDTARRWERDRAYELAAEMRGQIAGSGWFRWESPQQQNRALILETGKVTLDSWDWQNQNRTLTPIYPKPAAQAADVPAERPTCETCIHYRLLDEGEPKSCTRFPPQVVPDVYDDVGFERDTGRVQEVKTLFATQWPTPEPRHGCGEHPDFAAWFEAHGKREGQPLSHGQIG